jgi:uncharacterized protein (UPF0332 family)
MTAGERSAFEALSALVEISEGSIRSARILLEVGHHRGPINRSYYAVFTAARAALNALQPGFGDAKTHKTIISRFTQHLVKAGMIDVVFSRILTTAFDARLAADYEIDAIDLDTATTIVASAEAFCAAILKHLNDPTP